MAWDRLAHEYMHSNDSAMQEYIESNDSVIITDNAKNIIPSFDKTESVYNNVTSSAEDGTVTVSGKAQGGSWFIILAGSASETAAATTMPDGMVAGGTYFFWLDGPDSLRLSVFAWPGGSNIFETSKCGWFTIPSGTTGVQIRLRVPTGQTVPNGTVVHPYVGRNIPSLSLPSLIGFNRNPAPMLTIIDDDGNSKFYTKLLPVIQSKNVPITCALPAGLPGVSANCMTWAQVIECYEGGAEIISHTYSHLAGDNAGAMTEPEIEADYRKARNTLSAHGIRTNNILAYAGNSGNNADCVEAAKKVYDYAIHCDGEKIITQDYFRPYYIQRFGFGVADFAPESGETVGSQPKAKIDSLVAKNSGWMVWVIHTSDGDWTDEQVDNFEAAIDYAVGQGVQIVTCEYALKQFVKV